MRVLLIEDDPLTGDGIKAGLCEQDHSVDWITDGITASNALAAKSDYDAVILDLALPGKEGLEVLRLWRSEGEKVPVLVLSARKSIDDRVTGLNWGADDYMGKPFELRELTARLRAMVRRNNGKNESLLIHGNMRFDTISRMLFYRGKHVVLSGKELRLMEVLFKHRRQTLSRSFLESKLYPFGGTINSNSIEVHVHRIRQKINRNVIQTVHGIGYTLGDI